MTASLPRRSALVALAIALLVAGCGEDKPGTEKPGSQPSPAKGGQDPANPYGFKVWHADFPVGIQLPSHRRHGKWYTKNRQRALQKVIANIEGSCTKPAWHMAKLFFDRDQGVEPEILIEALDRALPQKAKGDHAHNLVEVLGRMKNPAFAEALLRAAQHSRMSIRRNAIRAMIYSGTRKVVLQVEGLFSGMSKVEQADWVKAAYAHLDDEQLMRLTALLLTDKNFRAVQTTAMELCLKLPPARANKLIKPVRGQLPKDLHIYSAAIGHAVGDDWGTGALRQILTKGSYQEKLLGVLEVRRGKVEPLLDELLHLSVTTDEKMAVALIRAIGGVEEERAHDTLVMYAAASSFVVRQAALQELLRRGHTEELDRLIEVVRKGTGATLQIAVADLEACKYGKFITALMERYPTLSSNEKLSVLKQASVSNTRQGFEALRKVFMGPEQPVATREKHTTITFMGTLFPNLTGHVEALLQLYGEIPKTDYRRRAAVLQSLAGLANLYEDRPWRPKIYKVLRDLLYDKGEIPQLRVMALDQLVKDIRLDDAMELKRRLFEEDEPMRDLLNDYLTEFF